MRDDEVPDPEVVTVAAQVGLARRRTDARGGLRGWVTAVVGALVLAVVPTTAVQAAGTGSIAGTVTGDGGAGVADVVVHAWVPGSTPLLQGSATTAADGTYVIGSLDAGSYVVEFRTGDHDLAYLGEYYLDAESFATATRVEVGSVAVPGVDAALVLGATITGTVTDETGPISDATVSLFRVGGTVGNAVQGLQPDGSFRFPRVPAGTYTLRTSGPDYRTEFYDDVTDAADATQLTVTPGQTLSGLAISLTSLGSISGTVTTEQGVPIAGMPVQAWVPFVGDFFDATTAADGTYTLTGMPAGDYVLQFRTWDVPGHRYEYVSEYWDDSPMYAGSTRLVLAAGEHRTGVDADLELAATITGTVTNGLGSPLSSPGTTVYADSTTSSWSGTASIGPAGAFLLEGLPAGSYRLRTTSSGCVAEYYDDVLAPGDATLITVESGEHVTGLAIQMEWPSGIAGTVTDLSGEPMAGVSVTAAMASSQWRAVATGADGGYELSLPAGTYTLTFSSPSTDPLYPPHYYPGTHDQDEATTVSVTAGAWTPGADVTMVPYGTIEGTVTDGTGAPVADAGLSATSTDGGWDTSASTGPDGTYRMYVLGGSYVVDVAPPDPSMLPEYYDDATAETADPVVVVDGVATTGIDIELAWAATFTDVVQGQAFFREIMWLAGSDITTGHPDGSFKPSAPVTREAMAAFLHRFAGGGPAGDPTAVEFTDVGAGNPFHDDIVWLAQEGVTTGWPDGTFRPSAFIERQAMAAFLYRFAGSPAFTPPAQSPFVDVQPGDPFYAEICWLADAGITTGTITPSGTYFKPGASVERQAMAAFLYRLSRY